MNSCEAKISLNAAQRCLQRLCKHWSHKFQVRFDDREGHIEFGNSRCELQVIDSGLLVCLSVDDPKEMTELQAVVAEHLERMAGEPLQVDWHA